MNAVLLLLRLFLAAAAAAFVVVVVVVVLPLSSVLLAGAAAAAEAAAAATDPAATLGVDLGAAFLRAAVCAPRAPRPAESPACAVVPNALGARRTPACVAYVRDTSDPAAPGDGSDLLVGEEAALAAELRPSAAVCGGSMLLARAAEDRRLRRTFWNIGIADAERTRWIAGGGPGSSSLGAVVPGVAVARLAGVADAQDVAAEELVAHMLEGLHEDALDLLGEPPWPHAAAARRAAAPGAAPMDLVVAVPAFFSAAQRHGVQAAAEITGLFGNVSVVSSAVAAAACYVYERRDEESPGIVALLDVGHVHATVTVLRTTRVGGDGVGDGAADTPPRGFDGAEILAVRWSHDIGGALMDEALAHGEMGGVPLDSLPLPTRSKLLREAARVKLMLSANRDARMQLDMLDPPRAQVTATREQFAALLQDQIDSFEWLLDSAFAAAGVRPADVTHVELLGGASRVPAVQAVWNADAGVPLSRHLNADEAVVTGAVLRQTGAVRLDDPGPARASDAPFASLLSGSLPDCALDPDDASRIAARVAVFRERAACRLEIARVRSDLESLLYALEEKEPENSDLFRSARAAFDNESAGLDVLKGLLGSLQRLEPRARSAGDAQQQREQEQQLGPPTADPTLSAGEVFVRRMREKLSRWAKRYGADVSKLQAEVDALARSLKSGRQQPLSAAEFSRRRRRIERGFEALRRATVEGARRRKAAPPPPSLPWRVAQMAAACFFAAGTIALAFFALRRWQRTNVRRGSDARTASAFHSVPLSRRQQKLMLRQSRKPKVR